MKNISIYIALLVTLLAIQPTVQSAPLTSVGTSWTTTSTPAAGWNYLVGSGPISWNAAQGVFGDNGGSGPLISGYDSSSLVVQPSDVASVSIVWTSDYAGDATISGFFNTSPFFSLVDGAACTVTLNSETLGTYNFTSAGDVGVEQAYSFTRTVAVGDTIGFTVSNVTSQWGDYMLVNGEITAVPEPASMLLLGLGTLALLRRRRA